MFFSAWDGHKPRNKPKIQTNQVGKLSSLWKTNKQTNCCIVGVIWFGEGSLEGILRSSETFSSCPAAPWARSGVWRHLIASTVTSESPCSFCWGFLEPNKSHICSASPIVQCGYVLWESKNHEPPWTAILLVCAHPYFLWVKHDNNVPEDICEMYTLRVLGLYCHTTITAD